MISVRCRVFRIMRFKAMIWVLSGRDAGSATVSGVALRLLVSTAPKLISNCGYVCSCICIHTYRQADRHTGMQAYRQTDMRLCMNSAYYI